MRAMSEKVSGQRTCRCCICGDTVRHSRTGRPRVICRKRACELARHNQLRRVYERKTAVQWTDADWEEAKRVWGYVCAHCWTEGVLIRRGGPDGPPIPVCQTCIDVTHTGDWSRTKDYALTHRWVMRCKPGCPLPSPWKGAR